MFDIHTGYIYLLEYPNQSHKISELQQIDCLSLFTVNYFSHKNYSNLVVWAYDID